MSDFNTFSGKTVDDAIQEACKFFTTEREKLEVEIVSGGSTGIFGLVGKKKAQIRARRRLDPARLLEESRRADEADAKSRQAKDDPAQNAAPVAETDAAQPKVREAREARPPREGRPQRERRGGRGQEREAREKAPQAAKDAGRENGREAGRENGRENGREAGRENGRENGREAGRENGREAGRENGREAGRENGREGGREPRPAREGRGRSAGPQRPRREPQPARKPAEDASGENGLDIEEAVPLFEDKTPASQELLDLCRQVLARLLTPILEVEPAMTVEGTVGRVSVTVQDEEHSGLLIGREGQTLAALQYLANRILARQWATPVRLQINTGDYREKQDDNLRKMALYLADKAKTQGRAQSTKPLSSYHRRVVHMALQGDDTITTRSKGDGPMKRVIILPRRGKGGSKNGETAPMETDLHDLPDAETSAAQDCAPEGEPGRTE